MNPTIKDSRKLIGWILLFIPMLIVFRFDDVKGGLLLDKADYKQATGLIIRSQYKRDGKHTFNVVYKYVVKGNIYHSDKVNFGSTRYNEKVKAQDIVDKYPKGSKVTVYYLASDPYWAVLEPDVNDNASFLLMVIIVILLTGMVILFTFFKVKEDERQGRIESTKGTAKPKIIKNRRKRKEGLNSSVGLLPIFDS